MCQLPHRDTHINQWSPESPAHVVQSIYELLGVNPEETATQGFLLEFISDIYPEHTHKKYPNLYRLEFFSGIV
jgi:hypothetical protein